VTEPVPKGIGFFAEKIWSGISRLGKSNKEWQNAEATLFSLRSLYP
jgi:hypothetical protein